MNSRGNEKISMQKPLGRHLLFDLFDCDRTSLNDREFLRTVTLEAARRADATIVTDVFHQFNPQGLSGVVVIAESHVAIHTWPEHGTASVDVFSCGDSLKPAAVGAYLQDVLRARRVTSQEILRGVAPVASPAMGSRRSEETRAHERLASADSGAIPCQSAVVTEAERPTSVKLMESPSVSIDTLS